MLVILAFDEDLEDIDIIDVPNITIDNLEKIQTDFFKWIFDKKNDHDYWVIKSGEKTSCAYDSLAFIKWMNEKYPVLGHVKLIEQCAKKPDKPMPILYF